MNAGTSAPTDTAHARPATAWPLENALVSAALAAQRVPWIDAPARALGLTPLTLRWLTRQALAQVRRTASGRPTRLCTAFGAFLLPWSTDDAEDLLGRAAGAGALGDATAFTAEGRRLRLTPHAAPPGPLGEPLGARVRSAAADEAAVLLTARKADGTLDEADRCAAARRLARRIVLGDDAARDTLVSDMLDAMSRAVDDTEHAARAAALRRRLDRHAPDPDAYSGEPDAVEHALETVTRAVTDTAWQALALAARPPLPVADRAAWAVDEALRRYPPLAATVHGIRAPFRWRGTTLEAGAEILCATAWLRDLDGTAGHAPAHGSASLCAAPAPCGAAELAVLAATELARALTRHTDPAVLAPRLTPGAPPAALPVASLVIAFLDTENTEETGDTGDTEDAGRTAEAAAAPGQAPQAAGGHEPADETLSPAAGRSPAHYAAVLSAGGRRLEEHARRLADCARRPGWNHDAFGERCRMILLAHAERCTRAAADTRRAAEWLRH